MIPPTTPFSLHDQAYQRFRQILDELHDAGSYRTDRFFDSIRDWLMHTCELYGTHSLLSTRTGTDALLLALGNMRLPTGAFIAAPSLAYHAVGATIIRSGFQPIWVDVDEHSWNMDLNDLERALQLYPVRAVILVDNYGTPSNLQLASELCSKAQALLVLDACESVGSKRHASHYKLADYIAYSFSFTKPIHAFGMGGALASRNISAYSARDRTVFMLNHVRLPDLNAAYLSLALPQLESAVERLIEVHGRYTPHMAALGYQPQAVPSDQESNRLHATFARVRQRPGPNRRIVESYLKCNNVSTKVLFPPQHWIIPSTVQRPMPITELLAKSLITLPSGPAISEKAVNRVCAALKDIADRSET